jgi:hypothetical protein
MKRPMTDIEIAVRIVPTHVRWPTDKGAIWGALHDCVQSLHDLVRSVDSRCSEIERSDALDRETITRRRTELGSHTLRTLKGFKPFELGDKAASDKNDALERQTYRTPEEVQMYEG